MPDTHLTITIPGNVAPYDVARLEAALLSTVERVIGADAAVTPGVAVLVQEDARVIGYAAITAVRFHEVIGQAFGVAPLQHKERIREIAAMLIGDGEPYVDRGPSFQARIAAEAQAGPGPCELVGLTREQEAVADTMALKHGRSAVRPLGDGAVEIVALLDDIEMEKVCVERDGTARRQS